MKPAWLKYSGLKSLSYAVVKRSNLDSQKILYPLLRRAVQFAHKKTVQHH